MNNTTFRLAECAKQLYFLNDNIPVLILNPNIILKMTICGGLVVATRNYRLKRNKFIINIINILIFINIITIYNRQSLNDEKYKGAVGIKTYFVPYIIKPTDELKYNQCVFL